MPKYRTFDSFGDCIFWTYANMNMLNFLIQTGKKTLDRSCFGIRAKAFKSYRDGIWKIHTLYENNNLKIEWGKDKCWYCGRSVDECGKLTAEHIFPRAKGGDNCFDNIAYACKSCNSSKGTDDLVGWFVDSCKITPPYEMVCIYLKLVYKYALENNMMDKTMEDVRFMNLPFDVDSVIAIPLYC